MNIMKYSLLLDDKGFYMVDSLNRRYYINNPDDMNEIVKILNKHIKDWDEMSQKMLSYKKSCRKAIHVIDWALQNKRIINGIKFNSRDEFFIFVKENGGMLDD